MTITDLLFQLYSNQLQTSLLLEHREHPCHPPDKQKPQAEAKKITNPKLPILVFQQVQQECSFKFFYILKNTSKYIYK